MMHDVEERLRAALHRHASDAPAGGRMLAAVEVVSGRRQRRRTFLAGGLVATLAIALLGVTVVLADGRRAVQIAEPPAAPDGQIVLQPGVPISVMFPLTPASPTTERMVMLAGGLPTLTDRLPGGDKTFVTVTVSDTRPATFPPGARMSPMSVRGKAGVVVEWPADGTVGSVPAATDNRALVWPEQPEQWLELTAEPAVPVAVLDSIANAMVQQPLAVAVPFTFDLMPAGFVIGNVSPAAVTFRPPGAVSDQGFTGKITIMLDSSDAGQEAGRAVQVGGRAGQLFVSNEATVLRVGQSDGRVLIVQVASGVTFAEPDLLRFAAGIRVTASAQPGNG